MNHQEQIEKLQRELGEVKAQTEGSMLFIALGQRLINRICNATDMTLPDATDIELSLVRIITERDQLRSDLAKEKQISNELLENVADKTELWRKCLIEIDKVTNDLATKTKRLEGLVKVAEIMASSLTAMACSCGGILDGGKLCSRCAALQSYTDWKEGKP